MMRKNGLLFSFSTALLFLLSCHSLQHLVKAPTVKIAGVGLERWDFQSVTLLFDLHVLNPNGFGIKVSGYSYRLALQEKQLLRGTETEGFAVAAQGESLVQIPLTLPFRDIYALIQDARSLDSLAYELSGVITPSGILSNMTIPYSKSGFLPNPRIPELSLQGLSVNKLNLSGMDLDLVIRLKNPNSFGFQLGKLDYTIQLAGQSVATGQSLQATALPCKGSGEIRLPIKLDFLNAASSLKAALGGGSIECMISGSAGLETPFGAWAMPIETRQIISIVK